MKNIKNYKMSEINWKENFVEARLYSTNQPNKCSCGCVGSYKTLSFEEVAALPLILELIVLVSVRYVNESL